VDGYLHSEEEKQYKKEIWEFNNREYLEEQAIKEAAAAAERRKLEEELKNCSPESLEARNLAASVTAAVAKARKGIPYNSMWVFGTIRESRRPGGGCTQRCFTQPFWSGPL
ncbi:putative transcription factor, partial [Trifolium medium]|nr:putative transcription factor [Trifolium medium]